MVQNSSQLILLCAGFNCCPVTSSLGLHWKTSIWKSTRRWFTYPARVSEWRILKTTALLCRHFSPLLWTSEPCLSLDVTLSNGWCASRSMELWKSFYCLFLLLDLVLSLSGRELRPFLCTREHFWRYSGNCTFLCTVFLTLFSVNFWSS